MNYTFAQRLKMFLCRLFGHVKRESESWEYNDRTHYYCRRCNYHISTKIKRK